MSKKSSSAGGRGSCVSMMDSTWLTPDAQCCDSSGMPQIVTLCWGRGMARNLQQACRHVQADREHADQEDAPEGLGRYRVAGLLAEPDPGEGRHHSQDGAQEIAEAEGTLDGQGERERADDEHEHDAQRLHQV